MIGILVDTNILIDYSKGYDNFLKSLFKLQERGLVGLYINPIIITEYLNDQGLIHKKDETKARIFLDKFSVIELGKKHGILCAELIRNKNVDYLGDAFIAASCLNGGLTLATRNTKHFQKVKSLELIEKIEDLKLN